MCRIQALAKSFIRIGVHISDWPQAYSFTIYSTDLIGQWYKLKCSECSTTIDLYDTVVYS